MASERVKALVDDTHFGKRLDKYYDLISFFRFYPDLMLDMLKPPKGGINLHLDQRIFLRCDLRFFSMYGDFSRGYAKCISGDSLIYTEDGIKEIGEFFNYQNDGKETHYNTKVKVLNQNGELEETKLGLYNGKQKCNTIVTDEGYTLTATKIHKVLSMRSSGKIEWVETDKLNVGDYVIISRNNNLWGNNNNLGNIKKELDDYCKSLSKQSISHLNIREMPNYIDEDLALLYGYLIGDGCLTSDNRILFSNIGDSIFENYKRIMGEKFNVSKITLLPNSCDYAIDDKYLRKYLDLVGLKQTLSYEKQIPNVIFNCSQNVIGSFIRGMFDTDGTVDNKVVSLTSVSKRLIQQMQILLLNFGIVSRINIGKTKSKFGICYKLCIMGNDVNLFNEQIGFGLQRKQEKLIALCNKKHNTNKDIIPYQNQFVSKAVQCISSKHKFYNVYKGNNNLTYNKLNLLLSEIDSNNEFYNHFIELQRHHYYYAKVKSISQTMVDVYDFHLPTTHSFVSNGFVSHNTYDEVLDCICAAMLYPNITVAISAQTKENAADLLAAKWNEITKHYPLLLNELEDKPKFSKGYAFIKFKNGSEIDAIANAQSTKGQRRTRLKIEEAALLNNALFEDALAPVVEVPRLTVGKLGIPDPCELNQQIHFFTTAGFKGSDEYHRLLSMVDEMEQLNGKIVLGSNWMLPCWYGRGSSKSQILNKKKNMSVVAFAQNYEQEWVGASEGALVNINKLLSCRVLVKPSKTTDGDEIFMGVDVARSQKTSNNQSSIVVGRVKRNSDGSRIVAIEIVDIINVPNIYNFNKQAIRVKQVQKQYHAKMVICDGNGLGAGLIDALLTETIDPVTGENLGCWDTINDDNEPEIPNSPKILYNLKAQSCQNEIVTTFIDYVESAKLKLLERKLETDFTESEWANSENLIRPYIETDAFIEEAANLKMKHLANGGITIERVARKVDKDRVSALIYMLWYVEKFAKDISIDKEYESTVFVN